MSTEVFNSEFDADAEHQNIDRYSICNRFGDVQRLFADRLNSSKSYGDSNLIILDAEISYTTRFFEMATQRSNAPEIIAKHFLMFQSAQHCMEHSEDWPYKPQWQFGFLIDGEFFFISNLEPYREATNDFLKTFRVHLLRQILVGQNIKFDLKILSDIMQLSKKEMLLLKTHDCMTMGYSLGVEQKRFRLDLAARQHLEIKTNGGQDVFIIDGKMIPVEWKHTEDFHRSLLSERFAETVYYNYQDLLITSALHRELRRKIHAKNLQRCLLVYSWFVPFHTLLERNGIYINQEGAKQGLDDSIKDGLMNEVRAAKLIREIVAETIADGSFLRLRKVIESSDDPEVMYKRFSFFNFEKLVFVDGSENVIHKNGKLRLENPKSMMSISAITGAGFREFVSILLEQVFDREVPKTPSGLPAFQQEVIEKIQQIMKSSPKALEQKMSKLLESLLRISSLKANLARMRAFYVLPTKLYPDQRLHHEYKITGTETGRLSNVRPGVMNMPYVLKWHIVSQVKGGKIVQIDLASAEAKLFMLITQNQEILAELQNTSDTYSVIGVRVFKVPITKKTRPIERNVMKIGILAKMYGQSLYGLAGQLQLYYYPVLWEVYLNREKYPFMYDWDLVHVIDQTVAERAATYISEPAQQAEIIAKRGKIEELPLELQRNMNQLAQAITVEYFKFASIVDLLLEQAISSGDYENWVSQTFFLFDDPANSYAESPVGLRRNFDMSPKGLFSYECSEWDITCCYGILKAAFKAFFLDGKEFTGRFWTGTETVAIQVRRLHAFTAFEKLFEQKKRQNRNVYNSEIVKLAKLLDYPELVEDIEQKLRYVLHTQEASEIFLRAARRIEARYREALNFPIQGTSSFINSCLGKAVYLRCLEEDLDVDVINTVHDAVHYELSNSDPAIIDRFKEIANEEYSNRDLIENILDPGLRALHPGRTEFQYIAIGAEIEVCDCLGQTK